MSAARLFPSALALMSVAILVSAAQGQPTWYVDADTCPGAGSGTEEDPFCAIQTCIDAAANGDECVVAPGTYFETINFNGRAITLRSTDPTNPAVVAVTIIDGVGGSDSVVTCNSGEGPDTVLDGFTITGGSAGVGGGMRNNFSDPTVSNCTFTGNTASFDGGGMHNTASSPTVTDCTFSMNTATDAGDASLGGGMHNRLGSSPTVTNCTFSGNSAGGSGGGMHNLDGSSPTVTDCTFSMNTANGVGLLTGRGGGMCNRTGSDPTVTNCTFSGNSASGFGGGMFNQACSPTITGCTFSANTCANATGAYSGGGGMFNNFADPTVTWCTFSGNLADNEGGGMKNSWGGSVTVTNCTFSENAADFGGGMFNDGSGPTVTNCSFSGNTARIRKGGGMANEMNYVNMSSKPKVTNCTFTENTTPSYGGGMYNGRKSSATIINCTFSLNTATSSFGNGGAMYNVGNVGSEVSRPTMINCTFAGNTAVSRGGGMTNQANAYPTVINCTFSGNIAGDGGAIFTLSTSSHSTVRNSILWENTPNQIAIFDPEIVTTVTYSDVQGGWDGVGNIDADPLFVDADGDNLRLLPGSRCIDAADNTAVPPDVTDLDGDGDIAEPVPFDLDLTARFVEDADTPDTGYPGPPGPMVDMGSYEYHIPGDGDQDGDTDLFDYSAFLECFTGPGGGVPNGCALFDTDWDGDVDFSDFHEFQGLYTGPCGIDITQQPLNATVCPGDKVTFLLQAAGGFLSYQWQVNGGDIPGETTDTLVIPVAGDEHEGQYRCVVTDNCDHSVTSDAAALTISGPATIQSQPTGGEFCVGDSLFLFVGATGADSYQWYKDDVPIPGAVTFFFAIPSLVENDTGVYDVVVIGPCNDVQSDEAIVMVEECP